MRGTPSEKRSPGAAAALAAALLVGVGGSTAPAEAAGGVGAPPDAELATTSTITVDEPGTVIDGKHVRGAINVKADDVTIVRTKVTYGGYHSIRIFPGVTGTTIIDTTVECRTDHTNGVVFGNYTAERVSLEGCRNDFMGVEAGTAHVVDSTVDGVPFAGGATPEPAAEPTPAPAPTPTQEPQPSPEPTQEPEPSPEPTQEPEPAPAPTPSSVPEPTSAPEPAPVPQPIPEAPAGPAGDLPSARTTGVPDGVALRETGSITVTEPGTTIDAMHVRGTITIKADDVTVRRTLVRTSTPQYPIKVGPGVTGALIEDVEVDNLGGTGIGIFFSSASGTVRRADIHSAEDGIRIEADDVTIEDSYVHELARQDGGHHDSLQIRKGDNITIRGNNLQAYHAGTDDPMNAAIQIGSLLGSDKISDLVVENNLLNGGNYTINGGKSAVDSARYAGNRFGRDYRYGVAGNIDFAVSRWDDTNVWEDTGEPVR